MHEFKISDYIKEYPICEPFGRDWFLYWFFGQTTSKSIVIINFVFRGLIIYLIKKVGFQSHSTETEAVKNFVFMVTFINTALILPAI